MLRAASRPCLVKRTPATAARRASFSDGANPNSSVVSITIAIANAKAGRSKRTSSSRGRFAGATSFSASMPQAASNKPPHAAGQAQQHVLGEQVREHATVAGAERHAHGHFALPRGAADNHQVGDVGAGDQQHQHHRAQQHHQRQLHAAHGAVLQRLHHHRDVGVVVGERLLERRGNRRHLLLRRFGRGAIGAAGRCRSGKTQPRPHCCRRCAPAPTAALCWESRSRAARRRRSAAARR